MSQTILSDASDALEALASQSHKARDCLQCYRPIFACFCRWVYKCTDMYSWAPISDILLIS